jgi:hypothetical protein
MLRESAVELLQLCRAVAPVSRTLPLIALEVQAW